MLLLVAITLPSFAFYGMFVLYSSAFLIVPSSAKLNVKVTNELDSLSLLSILNIHDKSVFYLSLLRFNAVFINCMILSFTPFKIV